MIEEEESINIINANAPQVGLDDTTKQQLLEGHGWINSTDS